MRGMRVTVAHGVARIFRGLAALKAQLRQLVASPVLTATVARSALPQSQQQPFTAAALKPDFVALVHRSAEELTPLSELRDAMRYAILASNSQVYDHVVSELLRVDDGDGTVRRAHIPRDDFLLSATWGLGDLPTPSKTKADPCVLGVSPVPIKAYCYQFWYNVYIFRQMDEDRTRRDLEEDDFLPDEVKADIVEHHSSAHATKVTAQLARILHFYGFATAVTYLHELWADCWILEDAVYAGLIVNLLFHEGLLQQRPTFEDTVRMLVGSSEEVHLSARDLLNFVSEYEDHVDAFRRWLTEHADDAGTWLRGIFLLHPQYLALSWAYKRLAQAARDAALAEELRRRLIGPSELAVDARLVMMELGDPFSTVNNLDSVASVYSSEGRRAAERLVAFLTLGRLHVPARVGQRALAILDSGADSAGLRDELRNEWWRLPGGFTLAREQKNRRDNRT